MKGGALMYLLDSNCTTDKCKRFIKLWNNYVDYTRNHTHNGSNIEIGTLVAELYKLTHNIDVLQLLTSGTYGLEYKFNNINPFYFYNYGGKYEELDIIDHDNFLSKNDPRFMVEYKDEKFSLIHSTDMIKYHVEQHFYRISNQPLYTNHLITCSVISLSYKDYVGMMHIDALNNNNNSKEFIDNFIKTIKDKYDNINYNLLHIYAIINNSNSSDTLHKNTFASLFELIFNYGVIDHGEDYLKNNVHLSNCTNGNIFIFIIPNVGIRGLFDVQVKLLNHNVTIIPEYYPLDNYFVPIIHGQMTKQGSVILEKMETKINMYGLYEIIKKYAIANNKLAYFKSDVVDNDTAYSELLRYYIYSERDLYNPNNEIPRKTQVADVSNELKLLFNYIYNQPNGKELYSLI